MLGRHFVLDPRGWCAEVLRVVGTCWNADVEDAGAGSPVLFWMD
jgi:hypothetical protein